MIYYFWRRAQNQILKLMKYFDFYFYLFFQLIQIFYQTANKINDKIRKGLIDPRNENFGIRIGAEYKHPTMTSITNNEEEINTDKKT